MSVDQQLLYESRVRTRMAVVAGLAGLLLVIAAAIQLSGTHAKVDELTLALITVHKRSPIDVIGSVINAGGLFAVAWTLSFLFQISQARNPDMKPYTRWVAIAGGVLAGLTGIVYAVAIAAKAGDFVNHGAQTYMEANHLTSSGALLALPLLGQAAELMLSIGFVLIALNAMRVGLLTRFIGYLGMFSGVLFLIPLTPVPVVQAYWLFALAYLLLGRWPTGVPPAWRSGKAEKWPSSQALREQRTAAAGARGAGRGKPAPKPAPAPAPETVAAGTARARSAAPKRKRKRRR